MSAAPDRLKHAWEVDVQLSTGRVLTETVSAYWDPEAPNIPDSVVHAAKTQVQRREKIDCQPVSAPRLLA